MVQRISLLCFTFTILLLLFGHFNSVAASSGQPFPYPLGLNYPPDDPKGLAMIARGIQLAQEHERNLSTVPIIRKRAPLFPTTYDLRNVGGKNYITTIKNQAACGSCVAFATMAAAESTVARTTGLSATLPAYLSYPDYSESELYVCNGGKHCSCLQRNPANGGCTDPLYGWYLEPSVQVLQTKGILEESTFPYTVPASPTPAGYCPAEPLPWKTGFTYKKLNSYNEIKEWIMKTGPVLTRFSVFSDFPGGVFPWTTVASMKKTRGENEESAGHAVACFGWDDLGGTSTEKTGTWFCKNSWGTGWGASGFFQMGFGADGIMAQAYGISYVATTPTAPVSTDGTCGPVANKRCGPGVCCSKNLWCGISDAWCRPENCLPDWGDCGNVQRPGNGCHPQCGTGIYWATGLCKDGQCQCIPGWKGPYCGIASL